MAGKLANNVTITQSSTIVGSSSWPLFVPLQASQGYIAGRAVIEMGQDLGSFSSNIIWEKPLTTGTTYTAAFSTLLDLAGSRYDAPVAGLCALYLRTAMPNAAFTASGGNLASPITRSITLDSTNKFITPVDVVALKLALTTSTGFFSGTFKDGANTRTVQGVLLQGANSGTGYFMGSTLSGPVVIIRQP